MKLTYKVVGTRKRVLTCTADLSKSDHVDRIVRLIQGDVSEAQVREWLAQVRTWPYPKQSGIARVRDACCSRLNLPQE